MKLCNIFFEGSIDFENTTFSSDAYFIGTTFTEANFKSAIFKLDAIWTGATFNGKVDFRKVMFERGFVSFAKAKFAFPEEEDACRRAKSVMMKAGDRYWEDYYFYQEMEVKKEQNSLLGRQNKNRNTLKAENPVKRFISYDIIELVFIKWIFGYGIHPKRLIVWWVAIIIVSGIIYYIGK